MIQKFVLGIVGWAIGDWAGSRMGMENDRVPGTNKALGFDSRRLRRNSPFDMLGMFLSAQYLECRSATLRRGKAET